MRTKTKKILAIAAVPALIGAWAAFRPELLFVDQKVNETLPTVSGQTVSTLASAKFVSYAHETTGQASIVSVNGKQILRLSSFKTSNGPDVHVYLLKGSDPKVVTEGQYLDLGSIKGNVGDQNYELPAGTKAADYGAVNIWCKRFSVGFGGAALTPDKESIGGKMTSALTVQTVRFADEIRVTGGKFRADMTGIKGSTELIERNGQRYLRLKGVKAPGMGIEIYLVKSETVAPKTDIRKLTKVKLGILNSKNGTQEFPVSKDLDAWLYRSVTLWDAKSNTALSSAPLRSDQEKKQMLLFV
jgi:Electron transfer DM13